MSKFVDWFLPDSPRGMVIRATVIAVIAVASVFGLANLFELQPEQMYKLYFSQLRSNFFTGFLTVGSFMLSLKTFIVVKLKESVYDSESYRKTFEEQKHRYTNVQDAYYRPLRNLSRLLFFTITSAVVTAVIHVTFGLFSGIFPFIVCVFSVAFSFVMVLMSLYLIHSNIYDWLERSKDGKTNEVPKVK